MFKQDTTGQMHALEAITASIMILGVLIFAVQATTVTPLTISTSNQHVETQQTKTAAGVLEHTHNTHATEVTTLHHMILYWDTHNQEFYNGTPEGYLGDYPETPFGEAFNDAFSNKSVATNIHIVYETESGDTEREQLLDMGTPSSNAQTITKTIMLHQSHALTAPGETDTLGETSQFYAPNVYPDSPLYNTIDVEVTVWRI